MKYLIAIVIAMFLLCAAGAHAESTPAPSASDSPYVPDTNVLYPKTDHMCDSQIVAGNYEQAIDPCVKSMLDYQDLVVKATDPTVHDRLAFNEAYTDVEIADAYTKTERKSMGHDYALLAYNLFRSVTDPYFAKLEPIMGWKKGEREYVEMQSLPPTQQAEIYATLSSAQLHIGGGFLHLMQEANALYDDVAPEINELTGMNATPAPSPAPI